MQKFFGPIFVLLIVLSMFGGGSKSPAVVAPVVESKTFGPDGCNIDTSSRLINQRKVGNITNLTKEEVADGFNNECTVHFEITVDGKPYHVTETASGLEQMASICYYARERGRKDLLLDLGGDFQSESTIACKQHDDL